MDWTHYLSYVVGAVVSYIVFVLPMKRKAKIIRIEIEGLRATFNLIKEYGSIENAEKAMIGQITSSGTDPSALFSIFSKPQ